MKDDEKRLLQLLLKNSRMSQERLGQELGKSRNWVSRTIKRLVTRRIIRAYTTIVDPALVYSERNTILLVKTNPRELGVSQALINMSELESLDGISGEYSLLGLLRFQSPAAFNRFLDDIDRVVAKSGARTYKMLQILTTYKSHGFEIVRAQNQVVTLSAKEREILRIITRWNATDNRPYPPSQEMIGQRTNPALTQPAVSRALRQLEKRKVIIGYSIDVDFRRFGTPIKFFVQIKTRPGSIAHAASVLSSMAEVWDLHRVGDIYSLYATIRTESVDAYNKFLRRLYKSTNIIDTYSQISLEEWML